MSSPDSDEPNGIEGEPTPPWYADSIVVTIRSTNDFRFKDLYRDDGEQISIDIPPQDMDWSESELRNVVKSSLITPSSEPYRVSDTYTEEEAGYSAAFWDLLVELGADSLTEVAIPALVAYLTSRITAKLGGKVAAAAEELTEAELETFAKLKVRRRYPGSDIDSATIDKVSIGSDGTGVVELSLAPPDSRQFLIEVEFDSATRIKLTRMTRIAPKGGS